VLAAVLDNFGKDLRVDVGKRNILALPDICRVAEDDRMRSKSSSIQKKIDATKRRKIKSVATFAALSMIFHLGGTSATERRTSHLPSSP